MAASAASFSVFPSSSSKNNGSNPPQLVAAKSKNGCWICRFRKTACKSYAKTDPAYNPSDPRCYDCQRFNIVCCGYGEDRPSGPGIRKIVTARTREWISFEPNRQPGEPPLNLSDLWPEKTVVSSSPPLLQPESSDRISEFITPNTCFISPGSQSAEPLSGAPVFTPHAEARTVFPISPPAHTAVASSMPPPSLHVETTQAPSTLPAPYSQLQFGQPLSAPPPAPKPSLPVNTVTPPLFRLDSVPTGLEINSWPPSTSFFSQQEEDAALQQLLEPAFIDSPVPVYDSNPTIDYNSIPHTLSAYSVPESSSRINVTTFTRQDGIISEFGPSAPPADLQPYWGNTSFAFRE